MDRRKLLTNIVGWSVIACFAIIMVCRLIQFIPALIELSQMKFYPENVLTRTVISTNGFSPMWSKKTDNGSEHLVYTQLFTPDEKNLIYIDTNSLISLDYLTGKQQWLADIPEDSVFHLYEGRIFSVDSYDKSVPFAPEENINIPANCNSSDKSTLRVYDPHTGEKIWEYSYKMVFPGEVYFQGDSALISGLTVSLAKYISVFEVDIQSGKILRVTCQNYNTYSRISNDEGILSSNFWPILRDRDWKESIEVPAFIADGNELKMVDRQSRQSLEFIEFSGSELNSYDVQLIIQGNLLIVYLNDSNQFFAFQMK